MKRGIALLFTIVYLAFTMAPLWQANLVYDEMQAPADATSIVSFYKQDFTTQQQADDLLVASSVTKVLKHAHIIAKRKAPRANTIDFGVRHLIPIPKPVSNYSVDYIPVVSSYKAPIFLKNRVLLI